MYQKLASRLKKQDTLVTAVQSSMFRAHDSAGLRLLIAVALLLGSMASWRQDRLLAVMGLVGAAAISAFTRPAILAYNRGRERWLNRDLLGAIEQLSLALQRDPCLANAYILRGEAYFALGQVPQALEDFGQAIRLAPRRPEPYFYRGLIRQSQGDLQGATAEFAELVRLHPNVPHHLSLANLLMQQGSLPLALAHLDEAIRLDPTSALAHSQRARLHSYLGEWEAALADWSQAIDWDPSPAHYYQRGVTYACGDYFDEAIADLSRSLEIEPQQPNVLYIRGNLLYALGEIKAALDDYERAFRLEADMNRIDLSDEYGLYGRGLAYWNMGDKATAFSDLQAALQVSRQHHNLALEQRVRRSLLQLSNPDWDPAQSA
ncbi:tetratricopeptide (TPR) repeat protein [Thermostichus sp. MS-CIW-41]